MENLKVGDKLFIKRSHKWSGLSYHLSNVVRLTKTLAILENGTKLVNEAQSGSWNDDKGVYFSEYGSRYDLWNIATEDNIQEMTDFKYQQKILSWYYSNKDRLTFKQIELIYNALNK